MSVGTGKPNAVDSMPAKKLELRLVRYSELKPCYNAFIDCRTPGSEAKENFTIIGPGVSENPQQFVHITEPHGFNIGGARQPPGCVNSQHSHDSAEVFIVHTGHWRFDLGEHGDDAQVELHPGDMISLPTRTFRGFTNIGDAPGFLWAVLGQDDPGRVTWAPQVFDMARDYGLVLFENGQLIDTAAGEKPLASVAPMPKTTPAQAAAMRRLTPAEAQELVSRNSVGTGTRATALIGTSGPLDWAHGFDLDRIDIAPGEAFTVPSNAHAQVLFLHRGALVLQPNDGDLGMSEGDTISLPAQAAFDICAHAGCTAFLVRRS
jgi:quercetin dioxygenase-like cupin family protein